MPEHGMSASESCRQQAQPARERDHVSCNQQDCRDGAAITYIMPPCLFVLDMELWDLMFALLSFSLVLVVFFLAVLLYLSL
jgi:hypothetical protein